MKVSQLVVKTLREAPSAAELPSHVFLLRGGYVKQVASGLYSVYPLGKRILNKIEAIIREEMDAVGGQEIELPVAQPSELWHESGRYDAIGDELLRFRDRSQHDMVLAMTHEEAVTDLMRNVLSSYKQLPCMVYQFQLKFRDEPRPRGGLVRVREFVMKDGYSFHSSAEDLDTYYEKAYDAYVRIFRRVGIEPIIVQSDTGIMGGKLAHEFMLETAAGEDCLILSEEAGFAANQEIAAFDRESIRSDALPLEKVATPGKKTIEEVAAFLGVKTRDTMKAVFFESEGRLLTVVVRGDLDVSEIKIKNHLKTADLHAADENAIKAAGMIPGYASPLGVAASKTHLVLVDLSVSESSNLIGGANEEGRHVRNVNFGRDFSSDHVGDFAKAEQGHKCIGSEARLKAVRGIEIGNIFKLGTKFSQALKCTYLDESGKQQVPIMGCYGIGLGRLMAAVAEQSHDDFGPIWPKEIAPFQVHVLHMGKEPAAKEKAEALVKGLESEGWEVLYDDRDERPGVKFKDADLWGIPIRIAITPRSLETNACEWKLRTEKDVEMLPLDRISARLSELYGRTIPGSM